MKKNINFQHGLSNSLSIKALTKEIMAVTVFGKNSNNNIIIIMSSPQVMGNLTHAVGET